jgi:hypothetical protein
MLPQSLKAVLVSSLALGAAAACGSAPKQAPDKLVTGQSDFVSAPPNGVSNGVGRGGGDLAVGASNGTGGTTSNGAPTAAPSTDGSAGSSTPRDVEETDLYRLDAANNRLYYLNAYRGLLVFDVTDVDHPQLLGRSPIYGEPVEMVVHDGVASVVVADWYGQMDDGTPFHGSIVRGIDARDPANIAITGEAYLGGYVLDTRVVGDVLYAVTEQYPYYDSWYGVAAPGAAVGSSVQTATVSVASVDLSGGKVRAIDTYDVPGNSGIFNVTPNAILLASDVPQSNGAPSGATALQYLDISDPGGRIAVRGTATVSGYAQPYGADNGRWTLDFADDHYAHVVTSTAAYSNGDLVISTADFGNPDAPVVTGTLSVKNPGYSATTRFDAGRLYLTPNSYACYDAQGRPLSSYQTPLQVFDVSNPKAPVELGATQISGQISLMMPNGQNLFVLGNDYDCATYTASPMALAYFDMSDPAHPRSLGSADFGKGWTYSPAASTFKAFTLDAGDGLVVLPFSGWDPDDYAYNTGVQLFAFDANSIRTAGVGRTRGWVERGIFVNGRLISLSDLSLSVIDYSNPDAPKVLNELTLARNVVNARPAGNALVEVSSDFWDNDEDHSELRVIPKAQADETTTDPALATLPITGTNPTVFHEGDMSYVVSNVQHEVPCTTGSAPDGNGKAQSCYAYTQAVTVVDLSTASPKVRGVVTLPDAGYNGWGWGWGWYACDMVSWYYGADVVQVGTKLAFRRWLPQFGADGAYVDSLESLFVVDATNPDAPTLGSTVVTDDPNGWWGNLRAIGNELYAAHYEWVEQSSYTNGVYYPGRVGYYIDKIDLSDPAHPGIGQRINVPGFLVGGSQDDTSIIYTMDYEWDGTSTHNELAVLKLDGGRAYLLGHVSIPGYTGNVFVRGSTAYFSAQTYTTTPDANGNSVSTAKMQLYQVDLSDPANPLVLPSTGMDGWGWLLAVEGDHAFVTSGWYNQGIDIFKLTPGQAPAYDQFVRARGWWTSSLAVDADNAYLASGYWGVQTVPLSK